MPDDPYATLIAGLERPAPEQSRAFAGFVAGAHSWYKHLPPVPPEAPFLFFLDPNAGRVLTHTPNGALLYMERLEGSERFHSSERVPRSP